MTIIVVTWLSLSPWERRSSTVSCIGVRRREELDQGLGNESNIAEAVAVRDACDCAPLDSLNCGRNTFDESLVEHLIAS